MISNLIKVSVVVTFALSNRAFALEIVDNYCNNQAKLGSWTVGIGDKKAIPNIVKEFDAEHQKMVLAFDKMPIKLTESAIFSSIGVKPDSVIKIMKESARYQWNVSGKKSNLSVTVQYYKGCIHQISLMDTSKMSFYNRYNTLPTKP